MRPLTTCLRRRLHLSRQLPIRLVVRRELDRADEDLLRQFDPLRIGGAGLSGAVMEEQSRAEEAVFGEAEGQFVLPVGLRIANGIRRLQRSQVMRLGQQAGGGVLLECTGITTGWIERLLRRMWRDEGKAEPGARAPSPVLGGALASQSRTHAQPD